MKEVSTQNNQTETKRTAEEVVRHAHQPSHLTSLSVHSGRHLSCRCCDMLTRGCWKRPAHHICALLSTHAKESRKWVVPAPATTEELVELLDVQSMNESDCYRGKVCEPGWGRVFGGLLMGQSLAAAQQSVSDSMTPASSVHCYFVRPGRTGL